MGRPDPYADLRMTGLRTLRGASYWSTRPVTRLDLEVGAFDEISSADVPGLTDALLAALPGLVEHRCSVGERGGFVTRLRRGTYAPHILEHVALELQEMAGHSVGYGRARGGDRPGEYTVVIEHLHAQVGLRSAAMGLAVVQEAFAGHLHDVDARVTELRTLATHPDGAPLTRRVLCGVLGGAAREPCRRELLRQGLDPRHGVVAVSPAYLLNAGLPYAASEIAVVLDSEPTGVPGRYREPEPARRLMSVVAEAVEPGGLVIVPAEASALQEEIRVLERRVAVFSAARQVTAGDFPYADAIARVQGSSIVIGHRGQEHVRSSLHDLAPAHVQVAAALAGFWLSAGVDSSRG